MSTTKEPQWEEITPDRNDTWDFSENPEFVGEYMGKRENVGKNNSILYTFIGKDKTPVNVWGSAVLDTRLSTLKGGELVKIVYKGKVEGEGGRTYKDFEVFKSK